LFGLKKCHETRERVSREITIVIEKTKDKQMKEDQLYI